LLAALVGIAVAMAAVPSRAENALRTDRFSGAVGADSTAGIGSTVGADSTVGGPVGEAAEAPPVAPRKVGVLLESQLGILGFAGRLRNVAPPAFYSRIHAGYEPWEWLAVLAYSELAVTDTSRAQSAVARRAFPLFGFGGSLRGTWHVSTRLAVLAEASAGGLMADVGFGALGNLAFGDLESLGFTTGGRAGLEWHQVNPHLAFTLSGGTRYAPSTATTLAGVTDTPLLWDTTLGMRYAF
jgi:hypothetical protein